MIHNLTLTGDGTAKTLAALMIASAKYTADQANKFRMNWLAAICESGGVARIGDVNTSSSFGAPVPSTYGSQFLPSIYQEGYCYSATSIYLYIPNAAVVSLMWDA